MRELRVTVTTGPGTSVQHVHTGTPAPGAGGLLDTDVDVASAFESDTFRMDDAGLQVSAPFLGASDRYGVPEPLDGEGGHRAALYEDGVEVVSGLVYPDDIAFDVPAQTFSLTLVAGAEELLWSRLDKLSTQPPIGEAFALFDAYRIRAGQSVYTWDSYNAFRDAFRPEALLRGLLADAGVAGALALDLPDTRIPVRYLDSGGIERTILRPRSLYLWTGAYVDLSIVGGGTIPGAAWTARATVEAILDMFGWRLRIGFAPYPSRDLTAEVLSDRFVPGPLTGEGALPALDARVAETGYTQSAPTAATRDFAIRYATALRLSAPEPVESPGPALGQPVCPPLATALLAAERWAFEPREAAARTREEDEDDAVPDAAELVELPFELPGVIILVTSLETPDSSEHPDYQEVVYSGPAAIVNTETPGFYALDYLPPSGGGAVGACVWGRRVVSPAPGQDAVYGAAHAATLAAMRDVSRSGLWMVEGQFYTHGLAYRVGDESAGVAIEGAAWRVASSRRRLSDDETDLTLLRPRAAAPPLARPLRSGVVVSIVGAVATSPVRTLTWTWRPPLALDAGHDRYEVETRLDGGAWSAATETRATRHVLSGSGLVPTGAHTHTVRIRTLGSDASGDPSTSAWTEATVST